MVQPMTTSIQTPPPGEYHIDPAASTLSFRTRHFFGLGPVTGTFALATGTITVGPDSSKVTAVVSSSSVDTGNPTRDGMVRSKTYLDVEHHPDIVFTATGITPPTVEGTLTVCGTTAPVTLTVESSTVEGNKVHLNATTVIDRYDFGVKAMPGMTGRRLTFTLAITAAS